MLGAMFTPNRDRAKLVGLGVYNAFTIQLILDHYRWRRFRTFPATSAGTPCAGVSCRACAGWSTTGG